MNICTAAVPQISLKGCPSRRLHTSRPAPGHSSVTQTAPLLVAVHMTSSRTTEASGSQTILLMPTTLPVIVSSGLQHTLVGPRYAAHLSLLLTASRLVPGARLLQRGCR